MALCGNGLVLAMEIIFERVENNVDKIGNDQQLLPFPHFLTKFLQSLFPQSLSILVCLV